MNMKNKKLEEARRHIEFLQGGAKGWITLANATKNGNWRQYHFKYEQLEEELPKWIYRDDVFFSQNNFYKPERGADNIKELRALYVDIDCYKKGYKASRVAEKLHMDVFGETLPPPSSITYSGQGLNCIWLIEPAPYQALPLWSAIQRYFYEQLKDVGADELSLDAARVFRITGTTNGKNGQEVRIDYNNDYRYSLREIQEEYLPERKPKQRAEQKTSCTRPVAERKDTGLEAARLADLEKIAELRDGDIPEGAREYFCFLYRYWSCCVTKDPELALRRTLDFHSRFQNPLSEKEVRNATKSAEKAWLHKLDLKKNAEAALKRYPRRRL